MKLVILQGYGNDQYRWHGTKSSCCAKERLLLNDDGR